MIYDFGMRLKTLRNKKNLSQKQVAARLGVTSAAVSAYEHNTATPSVEMLVELALLYGVSADYLLGIDHRKSIIIEDLTPNQETLLEKLIEEFSLRNAGRNTPRR